MTKLHHLYSRTTKGALSLTQYRAQRTAVDGLEPPVDM